MQCQQLVFGDAKLCSLQNQSSEFDYKKGYQWRRKEEKRTRLRLLCYSVKAAASSSPSSSLGGPASDFSEQLLGAKATKRRKRIAGIDQDELLDPRNLADPDSSFCEFKGVNIHYKIREAESDTMSMSREEPSRELAIQGTKVRVPMILLHGFGASVFSWHRVMKPLAQIVYSKVLAFDRPAFGLTSRVSHAGKSATDDSRPVNPYSMAFSVLVTLYFIGFLATEKVLLVGHSAGSITAVSAYFEAPERVAALILVAPAILAPFSPPKVAKENQSERENPVQDRNSSSEQHPKLFVRLGNVFSKLYQYIVTSIMRLLKGMMVMANSLYKKALSAILRSALGVMLVRMIIDKFGIAAVKNAWYDAKQVTDHILTGYTKPLRIKDWDRALVEYTAAMLADTTVDSEPPLERRLHEIKCPVLIVTGDTDRLVPIWNSKRLSRAIPGSHLEIIKNCGHLPHEEKAEEFLSVVAKFLERVFSGSEEFCLQPSG